MLMSLCLLSDEPGTAACAGQALATGFWCAVEHVTILSSRVNDGVADCCDCSDEWNSGLECEADACQKYTEELAAYAAMVAQGELAQQLQHLQLSMVNSTVGRVLKDSHLQEGQAARTLFGEAQVPWGSDDAYFSLHDKCLSLTVSGYDYTLCLFKDLVQKGSDGRQVTIGKNFEWTRPHRGRISNGDKCPEVGSRTAVVRFECGLEPQLVRISEPGRCAYEAVVTTPAAC
jgi:hypothetical protein